MKWVTGQNIHEAIHYRERRGTGVICAVLLSFCCTVHFALWPNVSLGETNAQARCHYKLLFNIEGPLKLPSDVAIGPMGWIYVLDGTQDLVRVYNKKGAHIYDLGGHKLLNMPLGLSVSHSGEVIVADSGNHRIAIFPPGLNEPSYINVPSPPGGRPSDPTDAILAPDGRSLIVVDNDNHCVISLDKQGGVRWATGTMGRAVEEFRFPFLMDMDKQGLIYVVEVINTRVQVLDQGGHYVRFIGGWGIDPGKFFRPKGIAINDDGHVYVSDSYVGVVQVFDKEGDFVGVVSRKNGAIWRFKTPVGLAVRGKELFVVEMILNRVSVLRAID